jgi:hypothetical protein
MAHDCDILHRRVLACIAKFGHKGIEGVERGQLGAFGMRGNITRLPSICITPSQLMARVLLEKKRGTQVLE